MHSDPERATAFGRLSDGKSAAARDVEVRLGVTGVEITSPDTATIVWPYSTLSSAEPMTPSAIDALLMSSAAEGATLFVADRDFARELPSRATHLSARATRWRNARPWIAGAAVVLAVTAALYAFDISPSRTIAGLLPDYARKSLGRDSLKSMTVGHRVCHDKAGDAALEHLTSRLAPAADGIKFKVVVVDWPLLNAFAVPGEQIVLTRGLIAKAETADEVAGVLAHEMGHGIARDPETGFVRAMGLSALAQLLSGGSSGTLANFGIVLVELSYSREAEHNADLTALRILKGSGISPAGFAAFFKRMLALEQDSTFMSAGNILRTHPATEEREWLALSQPKYPTTPSLTGKDWAALKAICDQPESGTGKDGAGGRTGGDDI